MSWNIKTDLGLTIEPICPRYDKVVNELEEVLDSDLPFDVKKQHMDEVAQKIETNVKIWFAWRL